MAHCTLSDLAAVAKADGVDFRLSAAHGSCGWHYTVTATPVTIGLRPRDGAIVVAAPTAELAFDRSLAALDRARDRDGNVVWGAP